MARVNHLDIRSRASDGSVRGIGVSITGAALQDLVRTRWPDPYVLGISSGAALGCNDGLPLAWRDSGWVRVAAVCLHRRGSLIVLSWIAASQGRLPMHQLLLAGVIVNAVCSALMMFATSILNPASLYRVVLWLMGTLDAPSIPALIGLEPAC